MSEKNILIVFNSLSGGGAERVMYDLFTELKKRQLNVSYFLTINKLSKNKESSLLSSLIKKNRIIRSILNIFKLLNKNKKNTNIISALHEENFLSCIVFNKPILTIHNSEVPKGIWIVFYYFLYGYIARFKNAQIICVSKGLNKSMQKKFPKLKIKYIYNGLSLLSKKQEIKECEEDKYLMIGRFVKQKNHMSGIYAFAKILNDNPSAKLTIVGEGPLKKDYLELIRKLEINKSVEIRPWITNTEEIYMEHNVLLFPSLWEGFGNVIIEALHFGLNIIAVDCDFGPKEILFPDSDENKGKADESIYHIYGCIVRKLVGESYKEQGLEIYEAARLLEIKKKYIIGSYFYENDAIKYSVERMADKYIELLET